MSSIGFSRDNSVYHQSGYSTGHECCTSRNWVVELHLMPVYVYEHMNKPGKGCKKEIEVHQEFGSEHFSKCPKCGRKVKRIITTANFTIDHLSSSSLKEKGFSKLVRKDKGVYEVEGAPLSSHKD